MHNYKLLKDDNTTLLFDSCFVDEEDIQYALHHRFNILFTETSCSDVFLLISKLLDCGYTLEVIKHPQYAQGIKLDDKLYAKFIYHDINEAKKETEKKKDIAEENNNTFNYVSPTANPNYIPPASVLISKANEYTNSIKSKDWRCF